MRLKNFSLNFGVQVFKALAEEPRIRILNLMFHRNEMCISDLELILGYTQAKTSRHISYLRNAGIVVPRKVDQWVFYSIKEEVTDLVKVLMEYFSKDHLLSDDIEEFDSLFDNQELAKYRLVKNNLVA
ncbi:MAG: metalloregulator ArsR/SmtB family transcription factor [Cyclobacteriaceae bacterium]|nr:metalloregulator ArsR/SmtB family transcription factor [Cyclobacteriaceae bacterium]